MAIPIQHTLAQHEFNNREEVLQATNQMVRLCQWVTLFILLGVVAVLGTQVVVLLLK